ncbi:MAG: N-acetylmuramoyl-L-alanine amidase [Gelidibacter sp.]|nr:N-acetylmuramoyl-L-alanine amidase [Gelidibacter sp.]
MRTHLQSIFVLIPLIFTCFLTSAGTPQKNKDQFVVVLDAGHGGHDPGNLGNGFKEKDIALKIVLDIGKALERHPNIKVIYTRKTDVFVTLRGRAAIANKADADLFVSIHCNSHNSDAHGTETFVLGVANTQRNFEIAKKENEVIFLESDYKQHYEGFDPNSPESTIGLMILQEEYTDNSIKLARLIEDNFAESQKRNSRGVKQASLWVMHNTYMPSVLVEVGFLTYLPEGKFLNSPKGQHEMANSIYSSIISYKRKLDQNVGEMVYDKKDTIPKDKEGIEDVAAVTDTSKRVYDNTVFKVQLAASTNKLEPKPYNFKGLKDVSREQEGKFYKYFYGATSDYNKIKELQEEAKQKGFSSCFIVAYKNGKRTDLDEVLKSPAN